MIKAVVFDYDWVLSRWLFWRQVKLFNLARDLRASGTKVAILSNRILPLVWLAKLHKGLLDFDAVVWARRIGAPKPDPKCYREVIKKLGLKPAECLFVDNRAANIDAAESLGMPVLLANDTNQVIEDIQKLMKL